MEETDRIEENHNEAKAREAERKQKNEASFTFFMHGSLFVFFMTAFTFLLFLYVNKYPLILNNEILPEVLFACFGLLVFSFVSLFLLSFCRFLARAYIALIAGGALACVLGQILPYNVGNYAAHYLPFLPRDLLMIVADHGNQAVAVAGFVFFFVLLQICRGGAMAFLSLPALIGLFLLMNTAAKRQVPEISGVSPADFAKSVGDGEKTQNLIYLILANHAGYNAAAESWQTLHDKVSDPQNLPLSPKFVPAFYRSNKFLFHPTVYLRYRDKYRNIGTALNPTLTEIGDDLFNRDDSAYYIGSTDSRAFATRNDLFAKFKERGYRLNVYQTYPFDFCKGAGKGTVDFCETYPAPLGALYQADLSTATKLMLMFGHWLYSMPVGQQFADFAYKKLKGSFDPSSVPFVGNPLSRSLPLGQPTVLSRLRKDVLASKGKNVFFAHVNLPHYPYVYDENCRLKKDPMTWRSFAPYTEKKELNGELKRWEDYNRQLLCTYGQLEYLIKDLENAKLADKTTIVVHGDKGAGIRKEKADDIVMQRVDKTMARFKSDMTTTFAVFKPENKKAQTDAKPCDLGTLIARDVLGDENALCQSPDFANFTPEEREKAESWLNTPVPESYMKTDGFDGYYADWREKGGDAFMASLDERLTLADKAVDKNAKIGFVAPPDFAAASEKTAAKPAKQNGVPDFFPVPTPGTDAVPPPPPPAVDEGKAAAPPPPPADAASDAPKQADDTVIETPAAGKNAIDIIVDDFGAAPAPMKLPPTDAEEKWKTADIKAGQETTLEKVPDEIMNADGVAAHDVPPAPESAETPAVVVTETPAPATGQAQDVPPPPPPATEQNATIPPPPPVTEPDAVVPPPPPAVDEEEAARLKARADEEARLKAEAKEQARAEAEEKARGEAEEKARLAAERKARVEAEVRAREEERRKIREAEEAKARAEAEARAKIEAEEKAKRDAELKAKAEEEARARAEAERKAREEAEKRTKELFDVDRLDITRETVTERVNDDGEVETFIYIERKPNPNRFNKKPKKIAEGRDLPQDPERAAPPVLKTEKPDDLIRQPVPDAKRELVDDSPEQASPDPAATAGNSAETAASGTVAAPIAPAVEPPPANPAAVQPNERVLDD